MFRVLSFLPIMIFTNLYCMDISKELKTFYQEDQKDRKGFCSFGSDELKILKERDLVRKMCVLKIINTEEKLDALDYFYAAMIFQHGDNPQDFLTAYTLAKKSVDAGCAENKWLMASAYDRWLMHQELPQKYGTQLINFGNGWQLWDTDPSTTDEERSEYDVPTLEQQMKRAEELNAVSQKQ